jgi:hypothetical protein
MFLTPLAMDSSTLDALGILAVALGIAGVAILLLFAKDKI